MARIAGVLIAALIAFLGVVVVGELFGFWAYPAAEVPYPIIYLPRGAKLLIVLTWLGGSAAAALVARQLDGRPWLVATAAGLGIVYAGASMLAERHPLWMMAAGLVGPLLIAAGLARRGRRA